MSQCQHCHLDKPTLFIHHPHTRQVCVTCYHKIAQANWNHSEVTHEDGLGSTNETGTQAEVLATNREYRRGYGQVGHVQVHRMSKRPSAYPYHLPTKSVCAWCWKPTEIKFDVAVNNYESDAVCGECSRAAWKGVTE